MTKTYPRKQHAVLGTISAGLVRIKASELDFSLSNSYQKSFDFAGKVLLELNKSNRDKLLKGLLEVFEVWKDEYGVYPPKKYYGLQGVLLGFGNTHVEEQKPIKEYIEKQDLEAISSGVEPEHIWPWKCHDYADTPIKLFHELISIDYLPLKNFLKENKFARLDYVFAILIWLTDDPKTVNKSSDVIEAGLSLYKIRLNISKMEHENTIRKLKPSYEQEIKRRIGRSEQARIKREDTERKVLELHHEYIKKGKKHKLSTYSTELKKRHGDHIKGFSESNITKILTANGYKRYKNQ